MIFPSISFIIPTISFDERLMKCISSLLKQNYDQNKIEIIISYGGEEIINSTFNKGNIKIKYLGFYDNPEARKYAGSIYALNDLICFIDSDNLPSSSNWLINHVRPFENNDVLASYSQYYGFDKTSSTADKYFALIGGNDPFVYYLKKNDRVEYLSNNIPHGLTVHNENNYYSICSLSSNPPVIGANGFFIKRINFQNVLNNSDPVKFFHTDSIIKIFEKYPNSKISIIKDFTYHNSFLHFKSHIKKRLNYFNIHSKKLLTYRTYKIISLTSFKDLIKIFLVFLKLFTFILPFINSIKIFNRTKKLESFYEIFIPHIFFFAYLYNFCRSKFYN